MALIKGHVEAERKRKSHKKSRRGCRNCKLRRVKCDERQPRCRKCTDYGVSCNYGDSKALDLQMSFQGFAAPVLNMMKVPQSLPTPLPIMIDNFQDSSLQLDRQMLDRLGRFKARTVLSMGNQDMAKLYQKEAIKLACRAPYLMHIIQTITMIHDRYLAGDNFSKTLVADICYHWSQGVSMFNRKLSSPLQDEDRDPLWSTAALSGIIAFAAVDATHAEDAWPLKPADDSDLDWFRMSEGKVAVFKLTNPMRYDSIFYPFLKRFSMNKTQHGIDPANGIGAGVGGTLDGPGIEQLPWQFIPLFELDKPGPNQYFATLHTLGRLLPMECSQTTVADFLGFISHVDAGFKNLLEIKDHRAMLVLAYWYAKVCNTDIWWMDRRSTIECQAICLYLERYSTDMTIVNLLEFPKKRCGLGNHLSSSSEGSSLDRMGAMESCFSIIESH